MTMSYLIEDILVFGEDRPSEEVLNDTEVQDLVSDGHTDPRSRLGGRRTVSTGGSLGRAGLIDPESLSIYEPRGPPVNGPLQRGLEELDLRH